MTAAGAAVMALTLTGCEAVDVDGTFEEDSTLRITLPLRPYDCPDGFWQHTLGGPGDWGGVEPTGWEAAWCMVGQDPGQDMVVGPGDFRIDTADGTLSGTVSGTVDDAVSPSGGPTFDLVWSVTGGTGRFDGATGSLDVDGASTFAGRSISGMVRGTVTIPG